MFDSITEMFSLPFMQRAIIVGVMVGVISAMVGVNLVLKNYSMIGDGLSHVGFGAFTIAVAFNFSPLWFAIPAVIAAAFVMLKINKSSGIKADSIIALLSSSALAIGVIITSLTKGMNIDIYQFMFGSILANGKSEVLLSIVLSLVVLVTYIIFYNRIFAITFDENFTKSMKLNVELYRMILAILTAVVIVVGMRIMGALLISSLILFPALTGLRLFRSFKACLISSAVISAVTIVIGIYLSYLYSLPTGAIIVVVNLIFWITACLFTTFTRK